MRIAAGVLLLVVSLVHGCAGSGLVMVGSCSSTIGRGIDVATHDSGKLHDATHELETMGTVFMAMGALMVALMGLQIACGVQLFRNKSPGLIMGIGIAGIAIDALVLALSLSSDRKQHEHSFNLYLVLVGGLVASALAIAASRMMKEEVPLE